MFKVLNALDDAVVNVVTVIGTYNNPVFPALEVIRSPVHMCQSEPSKRNGLWAYFIRCFFQIHVESMSLKQLTDTIDAAICHVKYMFNQDGVPFSLF